MSQGEFSTRERLQFRAVVVAALVVWAWYALPILLGKRTLFMRDVINNHFALRYAGAEALKQGEIPAFVERLGNGLPYRGNPAAVPMYPDNLLYLVTSFWTAFGGHFVLHWLLAALTMCWLARVLGLSRWAAFLAAVTYAGGGFFVSAMSFYNVVAVIAWWPAVIAAAVVGGRFGIAAGGLFCGLALLGGEPITAFIGMVPVLTAAAHRHGFKRGLGIAVAVGALGVLIASPQIVATSKILNWSFRSYRGVLPGEAAVYVFKWPRLLELLVPFPFGHAGSRGIYGWWLTERIPFYYCLYGGVTAAWLAVRALRKPAARPWWLIGVLGLLIAWTGGVKAELIAQLTGGLFRYSEKFLLWYALALALLAGFGLDALLERPAAEAPARPRRYLGTLVVSLVLVAAAVLPHLAVPKIYSFLLTERSVPEFLFYLERALLAQALMLSAQLAAVGLFLILLAWCARRPRAVTLVALQLVALLPVMTLVLTDSTRHYTEARPWTESLPAGSGFVDSLSVLPAWGAMDYRLTSEDRATRYRYDAVVTSEVTGLPRGLRFPLQLDSEGLGQATYLFLSVNMKMRPWNERAKWLSVLGTDALISGEDPHIPALAQVDQRRIAGPRFFWLKILDPFPFLFSPEEVLPEPSPADTIRRVSKLEDLRHTVLADRAFPKHQPGTKVDLVSKSDDRVVFDVDGPGGLVVVRRLYHPTWRARIGEQRLRTAIADLVLIGVEVPPGKHRVVLEVPYRDELAAAVVALITFAACGWVAWRHRAARKLDGAAPSELPPTPVTPLTPPASEA
jgi:hypothetical protein